MLILYINHIRQRSGTRLRQSSPFCGILTAEERLGIIREFQARESAAA